MTPILEVSGLTVFCQNVTVCSVAKLQVSPGERIGLIGPNGSGKTTLLRVLSGLQPQFDGEFRTALPPRGRVYVHQSPLLFRGTVFSNVTWGLAARGLARSACAAVARRWLAILGIEHLSPRRAATLSGGEARRVALCRAFAMEPELLLLDEPFADLDSQSIDRVCRALAELKTSAVILASPTGLPEAVTDRLVHLTAPN